MDPTYLFHIRRFSMDDRRQTESQSPTQTGELKEVQKDPTKTIAALKQVCDNFENAVCKSFTFAKDALRHYAQQGLDKLNKSMYRSEPAMREYFHIYQLNLILLDEKLAPEHRIKRFNKTMHAKREYLSVAFRKHIVEAVTQTGWYTPKPHFYEDSTATGLPRSQSYDVPRTPSPISQLWLRPIVDDKASSIAKTTLLDLYNTILTTKWKLGIVGGESISDDKAHGNKVPKKMADLFEKIKITSQNGQWEQTLIEVNDILTRAIDDKSHTLFNQRHEETKQFYQTAQEKVFRAAATMSGMKLLKRHSFIS